MFASRPSVSPTGALDLQALLAKHGYKGTVFGHASAGNLHFLITPSLNTKADTDRFDAFMKDIVALVVDKYDGSLKAEHGTGRNVAPFVEGEWGAKLTGLMWKLKRLADPDNILAPGSCCRTIPRPTSTICTRRPRWRTKSTAASNADIANQSVPAAT